MESQCQSCHGNLSTVGSPNRVGWFMEPNCASCHTGTATSNNGQIRYPSVFTDTNFTVRVPVNQTFSTKSNTPAGGLSLFRFSGGHGGLQCEACHGSTHAEFPSIHPNDNVRDIQLQGHAGVMVECTACHTTTPTNYVGGPHGMHPVGAAWVSAHPDFTDRNGSAQCQACHGTDSTPSTNQFAQHIFAAFGTFSWQVVATVGSASATNTGNILITAPVALALAAPQNSALRLAWSSMMPDVVVEQSATLGFGAQWLAVTNLPVAGPVNSVVNLPVAGGIRFFRIRQPW